MIETSILTVNVGSTSAKLAVFEANGDLKRVAATEVVRSNRPELDVWPDALAAHCQPPAAVVHRIVHGGDEYAEPGRDHARRPRAASRDAAARARASAAGAGCRRDRHACFSRCPPVRVLRHGVPSSHARRGADVSAWPAGSGMPACGATDFMDCRVSRSSRVSAASTPAPRRAV